MRDAEPTRLARLVALQTLLQTKRLVTAPDLAARCAVSVRTIYRDLKTLEQAGVLLLTEEGKGYRLGEGYRLPPVMLTEAEANALVTVEQLLQAHPDTSLVAAYAQVAAKVKAVLREPTREKAALLATRLKVYATPSPGSTYLAELQQALTNHRVVRLHYQTAAAEVTNRLVEPFALLLSTEQHWLLVGWCGLRGTYCHFRLDRIHHLEVLPDTFAPHPLTLPQYFASLRG
jgi:predicted DNA-binding transcriptional regulator YafY